MPKDSSRPSLPTSSSDFALPPSSSSSSVTSSPSHNADDPIVPLVLPRFRRPSLLAPKSSYFADRLHSLSPLAASATVYSSRRRGASYSAMFVGEESESDRDRMWTDSSPSSSSQNPTPPEYSEYGEKESKTASATGFPHSPPRRSSSGSLERDILVDLPIRTVTRRLSFPVSTFLALSSRPPHAACVRSFGHPAYAPSSPSLAPVPRRLKSSPRPRSSASSPLALNCPRSPGYHALLPIVAGIPRKLVGKRSRSGRRTRAMMVKSTTSLLLSRLAGQNP